MHIRFESYEDGGRIFVDGELRETVDRELDIEDAFPLLRALGATIEAFQYEAIQEELTHPDDQPNPHPPDHDFG